VRDAQQAKQRITNSTRAEDARYAVLVKKVVIARRDDTAHHHHNILGALLLEFFD